MQAFVQQCSRASTSSGKGDLLPLIRLVEAGQLVLAERALTLLRDSGRCPVLLQFSCDTTPVKHRVSATLGSGSNKQVRHGKSAADFQVQQVFLSVLRADSDEQVALLVGPPFAVEHGKTMPALSSIALKCPGLQVLNPYAGRRICIMHQVHGNAVGASLRHCVSGFWVQGMVGRSADGGMLEGSDLSGLLTWHSGTNCALHDAHNSLRWAHQTVLGKKESVLKAVYAATPSMKNVSFAGIAAMGPWLLEVTEFREPGQCPKADDLHHLYTVLGLSPDLVDELQAWQCCFGEGTQTLCVARDVAMCSEDWLQAVSCMLLSVFQFQVFSESRWLTVGSSCRAVLGAWMLGYFSFLQYMRKQKSCSEYQAHGVDLLGEAALRFIAVVALSSQVAEAVLLLIMKDCRLRRQYDALCAEIAGEVDFLEHVHPYAWAALSNRLKCTASSLRDEVVWASYVTWAYLHRRVPDVLESLPFSMCAQKPSEALASLRSLPECPAEAIAGKIWQLLAAGCDEAELARGLEMLSRVGWSTRYTETQHFSCAMMRKYHPEAGRDMLIARSFMHTVSEVLPIAHRAGNRRLDKLRRKLLAAERQRPSAITGRHVFLRDVAAKLRAANAARTQSGLALCSLQKLMAIHSEEWSKLPPERKQLYDDRALWMCSEGQHQQNDSREALQEALSLETERAEDEESVRDKSMVASAATLSEGAWHRWALFAGAGRLQDAPLRRRRAEWQQCPQPLGEEEAKALSQQSECQGPAGACKGDVYHRVAQQRVYFGRAAFAVPDAEGTLQWYRLALALKSLLLLSFLNVHESVDREVADLSVPKSEWWNLVKSCFSYSWNFSPGDFVSEDILRNLPADAVGVAMESCFKALGALTTHSELCCLDGILEALERRPPAEPSQPSARSATGAKIQQATSEHEPWMRKLLSQAGLDATEVGLSTASPRSASSSSKVPAQGDEDDGELVAALEENMGAVGADVFRPEHCFRVSILAGKWQEKRAGRHLYGSRYDLRPNTLVHRFVVEKGFGRSASFDYNLYGADDVAVLGQLWMSLLLFHAEQWFDDPAAYSARGPGEFHVPAELQEAASTFGGASARRWQAILRDRNGVSSARASTDRWPLQGRLV